MGPPDDENARRVRVARHALLLLIAINLLNYIDRYNLSAVETNVRDQFFPLEQGRTAALIGQLCQPGGEGFAVPSLAAFAPYSELGKWDAIGGRRATGFLGFVIIVAYMLAALPFGMLAERMSRWRLIALGLIGWSLATGLSGLAGWLHSFWLLIFARCLVGIGEAAYGPAAPAILSDLYPVSKRGQVLAWFYAAIPVGTALGYALGGFLAGFWGWQWAFYLMVPPGLLLGCYCYFLKDPPRGLADADECTEATRAPELRDLLIFARTPSYVLDTLGMTAMCFAIGGIAFWMPTYVYEYYQRTIDQKEVSLIFGGIVVVAGLTSTVLGGLISDWLRPKVSGAYFLVSAVGMLLGLVFFCLVVNAEFPAPFPWVYLFFAVFFLFFNTGPTNTILANVTHPCMRTNAVALNIFIIHLLGDAISPWIIGAVAGLPGCSLRTGFYLMSTMFVLSAGFWVWGMWYLEEDTRLAPRRGLEQG